MSIHLVTYDRRTRSRQAVAAIAAFSLAALALPGMSIAHAAPVNGVRAVVVNGTLEVRGDDQNNSVALRLASGDASQLQVDVGNDGTADFTFPRAAVSAIDVRMGAGDDTVKIDDTNGPFTTSIPTTISDGPGNDNLTGGAGAETFLGGPGDDTVPAAAAMTSPHSTPATTRSSGIPATRAMSSKAEPAQTRWCSTARTWPRTSRWPPAANT